MDCQTCLNQLLRKICVLFLHKLKKRDSLPSFAVVHIRSSPAESLAGVSTEVSKNLHREGECPCLLAFLAIFN